MSFIVAFVNYFPVVFFFNGTVRSLSTVLGPPTVFLKSWDSYHPPIHNQLKQGKGRIIVVKSKVCYTIWIYMYF